MNDVLATEHELAPRRHKTASGLSDVHRITTISTLPTDSITGLEAGVDQLVLKGDFRELNSFMNTISGVKDVRKQQYLISQL